MAGRHTHPVRRWVFRVVRIAVLVYAGLCAAAYFGQDWLLYPAARGRHEPPRPWRLGPGVARVDLTTPDGTPIAAAFAPAADAAGRERPDAAGRPTVLYFYGNGGTVERSWGEIDHVRRLGANVMCPDLPGYGASGGRPGEAAICAAADAAYDDLCHRVDPAKVIVMGWSLGGGPAVDLASRRPVAGLALFNAFTSMPEMAATFLPWMPGRYFCRPQFANVSKIGRVRCPTLVCNGLRDALIPASMSDRLAAAAAGPVARVRVASADHNTIFDAEPDVVWPAVGRLVDAAAAAK